MKNYILFLFIALLSTTQTEFKAQEFDDLLVLLVDEKYDKCLDKAYKYQDKDDTKRHPLPYLYAAQALYHMSRDHQYNEEFPNAYKDCLSQLANYRKKDKEFAYKDDALEFIETIKMEVLEQVDNYNLEGEEKYYKKGKSLMKKVVKIDPDCRGSQLLRAELEILSKNKTEGKKLFVAALDDIKKIGDEVLFSDLTKSQQAYLKYSLIFAANNYKERDITKARDIISLGQPFFGEEREDLLLDDVSDFNKAYKEITG